MSPSNVHQHVCRAFDDFVIAALAHHGPNNWDGLLNDLVEWAQNLDQQIAFEGLLSILEAESRYQYQYIAGDMLTRAKVPCPLELSEFIHRAFAQWNVSAATVPRYAASMFGREAVLEFIQSNSANLDKNIVEAMRYSLGQQ